MQLGKVSVRLWHVIAITAASVAHVVLFFLAYDHWSAGVGYFVLIPLITVAAFFVLRGGLLSHCLVGEVVDLSLEEIGNWLNQRWNAKVKWWIKRLFGGEVLIRFPNSQWRSSLLEEGSSII